VAEVDAGFQHFTHRYRHNYSRVGSGIRSVTLAGTLAERIRVYKKVRISQHCADGSEQPESVTADRYPGKRAAAFCSLCRRSFRSDPPPFGQRRGARRAGGVSSGSINAQAGNAMESKRLEELDVGLHKALALAERDEGDSTDLLSPDHPAARAALDCEVMLPDVLTAPALAETLRHKIDTVKVLLERARAHEALPPEAQLAANEGYLAVDDLLAEPPARLTTHHRGDTPRSAPLLLFLLVLPFHLRSVP
jgi:hypothetical protein